MASNWKSNKAGVMQALRENLGFTGSRNIAAWAVAGTLAYYLWVKPQQAAEQQKQLELARRAEWARSKGLEEVDRIRPTPGESCATTESPMVRCVQASVSSHSHKTLTYLSSEALVWGDLLMVARSGAVQHHICGRRGSEWLNGYADPQVRGLLREHRTPGQEK